MEIRKLLKTGGIILGVALGVWLLAAYILPLFLPFLLAFLLSGATQRPAACLAAHSHLPRWAAGAICILGAYCLLFLGAWGVGKLLIRELSFLGTRLPQLLSGLAGPLDYLHHTLKGAALRLPDGLGAGLGQVVDEFFRTGAGLLESLPQTVFSLVTALARKLPSLVLFTVTTVIASFMVPSQLPRLRLWLHHALPSSWRKKAGNGLRRIKSTLGNWLKAQGKLSGITFCITTAGLFLLRAPSPILAGLFTALVDFLPVFGSGAVLIPWAMVLFLQGNTGRGAAFLVLYGIAAITRATLEPRLVGKQMGLPPLITLASIYVGGKLCGIWGLVLFPLAASVLANFVPRPSS